MENSKNRVIKFRAWDKRNNRMYFGWGCYTDQSNIQHVITDTGERVSGELMQFTGLLDKNGKDIYEGDIVKYNSKTKESRSENWVGPIVIEWRPEEAKFDFKDKNSDSGWSIFGLHYCSYEIIGNIYENPELLK